MPSPKTLHFKIVVVPDTPMKSWTSWAMNHKSLEIYSYVADVKPKSHCTYLFKFKEEKSVANLTTLLKGACKDEPVEFTVFPLTPDEWVTEYGCGRVMSYFTESQKWLGVYSSEDKVEEDLPLEKKEWSCNFKVSNMKTMDISGCWELRSYDIQFPVEKGVLKIKIPKYLYPLVRGVSVANCSHFSVDFNNWQRGSSTTGYLNFEECGEEATYNSAVIMNTMACGLRKQTIQKTFPHHYSDYWADFNRLQSVVIYKIYKVDIEEETPVTLHCVDIFIRDPKGSEVGVMKFNAFPWCITY